MGFRHIGGGDIIGHDWELAPWHQHLQQGTAAHGRKSIGMWAAGGEGLASTGIGPAGLGGVSPLVTEPGNGDTGPGAVCSHGHGWQYLGWKPAMWASGGGSILSWSGITIVTGYSLSYCPLQNILDEALSAILKSFYILSSFWMWTARQQWRCSVNWTHTKRFSRIGQPAPRSRFPDHIHNTKGIKKKSSEANDQRLWHTQHFTAQKLLARWRECVRACPQPSGNSWWKKHSIPSHPTQFCYNLTALPICVFLALISLW